MIRNQKKDYNKYKKRYPDDGVSFDQYLNKNLVKRYNWENPEVDQRPTFDVWKAELYKTLAEHEPSIAEKIAVRLWAYFPLILLGRLVAGGGFFYDPVPEFY